MIKFYKHDVIKYTQNFSSLNTQWRTLQMSQKVSPSCSVGSRQSLKCWFGCVQHLFHTMLEHHHKRTTQINLPLLSVPTVTKQSKSRVSWCHYNYLTPVSPSITYIALGFLLPMFVSKHWRIHTSFYTGVNKCYNSQRRTLQIL